MASFKLTIADPKTGNTYQKEVKEQAAQGVIGLNIGENVKGDSFDMQGYEMQITGGSDYCGFPMRKGILGLRKKITLLGGVGFGARGTEKGIRRRKTVCGHKIHEKIVQINLKITKEGSKKIWDIFGKKEEKKEEAKEAKAEKKEEKKEAKEEKKAEAKKAEEKPEEGKEEKHKEAKQEK